MIVLSNRKCGRPKAGALYMISRKSAGGTLLPFTAIAAPLSAEIASPRKPEVVDVAAFELTDTRDDPNADSFPVIHDNAIGFNDFRGMELQIYLTPEELGDCNDISRNLGDNRGHGLHPSLFGPGG